MKQFFTFWIWVFVSASFGLPNFTYAQEERRRPQAQDRDADKALGARQKANIWIYSRIKRRAQNLFGGRVVGQNLVEVKEGRWAYVLKIWVRSCYLRTVVLDAHNGEVLSKGNDGPKACIES